MMRENPNRCFVLLHLLMRSVIAPHGSLSAEGVQLEMISDGFPISKQQGRETAYRQGIKRREDQKQL